MVQFGAIEIGLEGSEIGRVATCGWSGLRLCKTEDDFVLARKVEHFDERAGSKVEHESKVDRKHIRRLGEVWGLVRDGLGMEDACAESASAEIVGGEVEDVAANVA